MSHYFAFLLFSSSIFFFAVAPLYSCKKTAHFCKHYASTHLHTGSMKCQQDAKHYYYAQLIQDVVWAVKID